MQKPTAITPFWERFPFFFAQPFRLDSLLSLTLLSIAFWLINSVIRGGIVSIALNTLLFAALLRHAFKVLERIALGEHEQRDVLRENTQEHPYRPYKQFVALVVGGLFVGMIGHLLGPAVAVLASLLLILVLPASIMLLALTDNLLESINPEELWRLIADIGMPYLGLWGCLSLLTSSGTAASYYLLPILPAGVQPLFFFFINMYFVIVMYALMGYVLHQYHVSLGIPQTGSDQAKPVQAQDADGKVVLAQAGEMVRAGQTTEAVHFLAGALRANPRDLALREGYFRLLLASDAHRGELVREADCYIGVLLNQRRETQALQVLESVRQHNPVFLPADGQMRATLGRVALAAHKQALALALVKEFDVQFGNHAALPEILLLGARLASEHLRNDTQALKILEILLQRFPAHTVRAEALQLQTVISRLR